MSDFSSFKIDPDLQARLTSLLEAAMVSELTAEQATELESLLATSDAARTYAVEYLHLDALLARYECGAASHGRAVSKAAIDDTPLVTPPQITIGTKKSPVLGFLAAITNRVPGGEFTVGTLTLLVIVAAFWGLAVGFYGRLNADSSQPAFVFASDHAVWRKQPRAGLPAASHVNQPAIAKGESLQLASGSVELKLKQGATLVVEGPAEWSIDGNNHASLTAGRLVAKVPSRAVGFTLQTPTGSIVDLGTEFSVHVTPNGGADVQVLKGAVEVLHASAAAHTQPTLVRAGTAVNLGATTASIAWIAFHDQASSKAPKPDKEPAAPFRGAIPLGNLFDDRRPFILAEAVATDAYGAIPDRDHLGIERVYAGDIAVREIAPGIRLDLSSIGWMGKEYSQPMNDVTCLEGSRLGAPIQTVGQKLASNDAKIEDGIGMHANSLITFNLKEIRDAGALEDVPLRFVCDRFGLNDDAREVGGGSVHCLLVISDSTSIMSASLNGVAIPTKLEANTFHLAGQPTKAFTPTSKPATCDIPLPAEARYLTLAVTSAGDGIGYDHGVWSGARLLPVIEQSSSKP